MDINGNLPLHCVSPGVLPESTIQMLIHENPQSIYTQNVFGFVPAVSQFIKDSKESKETILSSPGTAIVRNLVQTMNHIGLVSINDLYYEMQCDLTSFIIHSPRNVFLNPKSYPKLGNQIESLFHLVTRYVYGFKDAMNSSRIGVPHQPFLWTSFSLFVRTMLQHAPFIAKEKDIYGELPLHIIVKQGFDTYNMFQCSVCSDFQILGPFLSYSKRKKVCIKCYHKSTDILWNLSSFGRLPLLEYQRK